MQCPSVMSYPVDDGCSGLPSSDYSVTHVTFVFSFTPMFVFCPGLYVIFNIPLSIFICAAVSLFFAWVMSAHVSAPYVIAGSTHAL